MKLFNLFTPQERGVILFLMASLIVGSVVYVVKLKNPYFAPEFKIKENKTGKVKLEKININTATKKELTLLPGIGPTYAQRIIKYREKYGPFKNISEITKIYGIGKNKFEKIKDKITIK